MKGWLNNMKINILGHEYKLVIVKEDNPPDDLVVKLDSANGLCENYSNELIVCDIETDNHTYRRLDLLKEKTATHELLHAYLFKSGVSQLLTVQSEEVIVDMLAINFDNINMNRNKILKKLRGGQ